MDSQNPHFPTPPATDYQQPRPKGKMPVALIVVIVVAAIIMIFTVLLIGMALTIPSMQKTIKRSNETSAIASLRMLNMMESEYASQYPQHGFACTLPALGGKVGSGPPTPESAQLINDDLAAGNKSGYTFTITGCTKTTINKVDQHTSYQIIAVPNSIGHSGDRGYCTDESAQIRFDPKGGTNCTENLQ